MFRKKHVGVVEVYDDDNGLAEGGAGARGRAGARGADTFDDLGLSRAAPVQQDVESMTAAELEAQALADAEKGREATGRALAMAVETREIGVATAHTMQAQTEQLERMGEQIEEVHDYLDKSDRLIDKMSKPRVARMFQRKKPTGKGLDKVRAGRKEAAEREDLKARGLGAVDLDGMKARAAAGPDDQAHDPNRDELFTVTDAGKKHRRARDKPEPGAVSSRAVREDYSQYSDGVANVMRKQDNDLDQISDALGDLKALADGMNAELSYQGRLIDEAQTFTDETSRRTKDQARRVNRIK